MRARCVLLFLLTAFLCGCSSVSSKAPLGNPALPEDAKKLAGVWLTPDGDPFVVRHIEGNELRVASVGWDKAESRFKLEEAKAFVTQDDDRNFINLVNPDSEEATEYAFMRVADLTDRSLVVILPRVDGFAKAVEDGVLPGSIKQQQNRKTVRLEATTDQLNAFVDPAKAGEQFDVESVLALQRVRNAPDDE